MKTLLPLLALPLLAISSHGATLGTWSASGDIDPLTDGWLPDLTGTGGWFQGDSAENAGGASGAGAGNPAWGFWSDSGGVSAGIWNLDGGATSVGQTVAIDFDNGWVNSGGVGVQFRSGSTVALSVFLNQGGPGYEVTDSTGNVNSGQGWTGDGFTITMDLTGSGTYSLDFLGYSGSGNLANSATTFDNIRVYSSDPTDTDSGPNYNVYANNVVVTPEASVGLLGGLAGLFLLRRRR